MGPLAYGYGTLGGGVPGLPELSRSKRARGEGRRNRQIDGRTDGRACFLASSGSSRGGEFLVAPRSSGRGGQRGRCTAETHRTSRDGRTSWLEPGRWQPVGGFCIFRGSERVTQASRPVHTKRGRFLLHRAILSWHLARAGNVEQAPRSQKLF